jgi:Leucine-rich repeat (LRR) protein
MADYSLIGFVTVFILALGGVNSTKCSSETKCTCHGFHGKIFANCSNLHLSTVPSFIDDVIGMNLAKNDISIFPPNLSTHIIHLDVSSNKLQTINQNSLSKYITLKYLTVSENNLQAIESGSFANLPNLQHLDISGNQELTLEVLANISRDLQNSTSIRILNFENLQCTYGVTFMIKKYHTSYLKHTHLEELNLASNRISSLELGVLAELPSSLKHLNIANNKLGFGLYIAEFGSLENIVTLNVSFQSSFHQIYTKQFLVSCNDTRRPACTTSTEGYNDVTLSKLSHLSLPGGPFNITVYLPPNLQRFYFHDNLYKMAVQDFVLKSTRTPAAVTHLYAQNNIIYNLTGPVNGVQSVRYVDLSNNFCTILSPHFFKYFRSLSYLDLSHNALGESFENDKKGEIFENLQQLVLLNISHNRIVRLPKKIFRNLFLLENLNLSDNSLSELHIPVHHMTRLTYLDLSNNQLSLLSEKIRSALDSISKKQSITVNLIGNRFRCDCDSLQLIKWMYDSNRINFLNFGNYSCAMRNSSLSVIQVSFTKIEYILQHLEKQCYSYTYVILLMTSLIIVVMTTSLSRIVYRYRWKLRFMYYVAREKYRDNVKRTDVVGESPYYFDAFVSYADKNRTLVIDLVKRLEGEYNLKLCIHHRDFIPGTAIADNITNAIHYSRRTVCFITSHFIDSYWCMFEMNMARMEAVYSRNGENALFLVVLQSSALNKLPQSFMDLVETNSYLEFPESNVLDEQTAFLSKLGETLRSRDNDFRALL